MNYLLDTNVCVLLIRQKSPQVLARLLSHEITDICLSAITVAELQYGVQKSNQLERNQQALDQFLLPLTILPFDDESAAIYGQIRASLEARGLPVGALDTLIAAQAVSHNLTLVTNNLSEFARVAGLTLEDWTQP
ncbi:MAG: type II toxin-antitoxin system VapC family toxin [Dehalococcoidia bacterium]|nr:type II toxin-antitoxin system VapC family toxin [Dehalococcoidia bacterium]